MKKHKTHTALTMAVILITVLAGCVPLASVAGQVPSDPVGLGNTDWDLSEMNSVDLPAGSIVTLDFGDEMDAGGRSFCNGFFGSYEIDGDLLTFGPLGSTMMACPEMDLETEYLQTLATVTAYRIVDGNLVLMNASGDAVLTFSPTQHAPLEGTTWQLTGYNTGSAITSLIGDTEITAVFEEGQVQGSAGCNSYFGSAVVDGIALEMGPLANTEMACMEPEGVMDQERGYLTALSSASSFGIDRDTLTVYDTDGVRLLTFIAVGE